MRFSVLVPVYNVEDYLRECLDSILGQDFADFELVVVDDGSTDASSRICDEYAARDARIVLVRQKNSGLLLARRAGVDVAHGEYLVCVDSDDALAPGALKRLDEAIRATQADMVCFQASRDPSRQVPFLNFGDLAGSVCTEDGGGMARVRHMLASSHMLNQMWCKAFKREIAGQGEDYSAYRGLQYGEDLFQTAPMFDKACSCAFIDDVMYYYRVNMASISHAVTPKRLADIKIVRGRLASYVARWDAALVPFVHANDCVEVAAYAIKLVLGKDASSKEKLRELCQDEFFTHALVDADLSGVTAWKRVAIRLLAAGRVAPFVAYIRVLFAVIRRLAPSKVIHYV